jgi:uncharacterized protein (TIGR02284 family)
MAVNREELIECLNDLIQTCRDGESGFQTAADHVKDTNLKELFGRCSIQRAQFASELESEVRQLGGSPAKSGSVSAAFHRGWMNIKSIVTGGSDTTIIAECERGEDAAVENYQRVLKQNLPPNVLPVAKHQFTEIKRSHTTGSGHGTRQHSYSAMGKPDAKTKSGCECKRDSAQPSKKEQSI